MTSDLAILLDHLAQLNYICCHLLIGVLLLWTVPLKKNLVLGLCSVWGQTVSGSSETETENKTGATLARHPLGWQ